MNKATNLLPSNLEVWLANPKLDWNIVEVEYVSGTDTLKILAGKYNVDDATMEHHSADGNWVEKRRIYAGEMRKNLTREVQDRTLDKAAETISDERARIIRVVDASIQYGVKKLVGERDATGNIVAPPTMKMNMRDLLDASKLKLVLIGETVERSEIKGMGVQAIEINFVQKPIVNEPDLKSDDRVVEQTTPTRSE